MLKSKIVALTSFVLVIVLALLCGFVFAMDSSSHNDALAAETSHTDHSGWTDLNNHGSTSLGSGKYYLSADFKGNLTIADESTVTLCLNGHKLASASVDVTVITIGEYAELTLEDCNLSGSSHQYYIDGGGLWVFNNGQAGWQDAYNAAGASKQGTVTGGVITGGSADIGAVSFTGSRRGYFVMNGGTIAGNFGIMGIVSGESGEMEIHGGVIAGNRADLAGIVDIRSMLRFTMTGGEIKDNIGRAINIFTYFTVSISGGYIDGAIGIDYVEELEITGGRFTNANVSANKVGTNAPEGGGGVSVYGGYEVVLDESNEEYPYLVQKATPPDTVSHEGTDGWYKMSEWIRKMGALLTDGKYYLDQDISLTTTLQIKGTVTLCLNGYTLKNNGSSVITVQKKGNFTLEDCSAEQTGVITGGNADYGGGVYADIHADFTMNGGTISGNSATNGGGVYVESRGTFTMNGGTISDNTTGNGFDVNVSYGDNFTMTDGAIKGTLSARGTSTNITGGYFEVGSVNDDTVGESIKVSSDYGVEALPTDYPMYADGYRYAVVPDTTFRVEGANSTYDTQAIEEKVDFTLYITFFNKPETADYTYTYQYAVKDSGSYQSGLPTDAGTYTIKARYDLFREYTFDYTIDKKQITLSGLSATTRQYDGTTSVEVTGTFNDVYETDRSGVTIASATTQDANAGDGKAVTVVLSGDRASNYEVASQDLTVNITKRQVAVEWSDTEFTYDGQPHKPTATVDTGVAGETLQPTVTGEQTNAGVDHTATASTDNPNYELTNNTTTFVINKAKVTNPTAIDTVFTYNAEEQTYMPQGFDDGTMSITNNVQTNANTYEVTVQLTDRSNYEWAEGGIGDLTFQFVINKAKVEVIWGEQTVFTYNGQMQAPTATAQGLGVDGTLVLNVAGAKDASDAHTATASTDNTNYELIGELTKQFSIIPKSLEVVWGEKTTFVYNGKVQAPTATVDTGIEDETLVLTISGGEIFVGTGYTATASTDNGNYTLTNITIEFAIEQKLLTSDMIQMPDQMYTGNQLTPDLVFVDSEEPIELGRDYDVEYGDNVEASGTITIRMVPGGNYKLEGDNLVITFAITKDLAGAKFVINDVVYTGEPLTPEVLLYGQVFAPQGIEILYYDNINVTKDGKLAYAVLKPTADSEYTGEATVYFNILPITLVVVWDEDTLTHTYDANSYFPSYTILNLLEGEDMSQLLLQVGAQKDAGADILASLTVNGELPEYYVFDEESLSVLYTILAKQITVVWGEDNEFIYDNTVQHPAEPTIDTGIAGESFVLTTTFPQSINVDTYTATVEVTAGESTLASNYDVQGLTFEYKILPKTITVEWSSAEYIYSGTAKVVIATVDTGIDGVTVDLVVTSPDFVNAGTHTATAIMAVDNNNFVLANDTYDYTIEQKVVSVIWTDTQLVYNGKVQTPTATAVGVGGQQLVLNVTGGQSSVGTYTAEATLDDNNYILDNASTQYTIAPKTVFVVWGSAEFTYNGQLQKPTATVDTGIDGENLIVTVSVEGGINAGQYTATATIDNGNYILTGTTFDYAIAKATAEVVWTDTAFVLDNNAHKPTATAVGVDGKALNLTVTGEQTATGTYIAVATTDDGNYVLTNANTEFTIAQSGVKATTVTGITVNVLAGGALIGMLVLILLRRRAL